MMTEWCFLTELSLFSLFMRTSLFYLVCHTFKRPVCLVSPGCCFICFELNDTRYLTDLPLITVSSLTSVCFPQFSALGWSQVNTGNQSDESEMWWCLSSNASAFEFQPSFESTSFPWRLICVSQTYFVILIPSVFFLTELVKITEQISSFSPLGNLIRIGMSVTAVYYFYSNSADFLYSPLQYFPKYKSHFYHLKRVVTYLMQLTPRTQNMHKVLTFVLNESESWAQVYS